MEKQWQMVYDHYDPKDEPLRETLCALGNGYFVTRAAQEENKDDGKHYPATYLAGGYNRLKSHIAGEVIENEDLVNWPNWLVLKFKVEDGDWVTMDSVKILDYKQVVNLREGVLERTVRIEDAQNRQTFLKSKRLVHMEHEHLAAIQWQFTPENWSGRITVHSALDGSVINNGVARYRDLESKHLRVLECGQFREKGIFLKVQTTQSEISMAQAARTEVFFPHPETAIERKTLEEDDYIAQELSFDVEKNVEVKIEKTVALFTSRDSAISDPLTEARNLAMRASGFQKLHESQRRAWGELWARADTEVSCEKEEEQRVLRLHIFHLLQTVSGNTIDFDIGVPSRGWHGEAYRGHILWDELFIFPILTHSMPELTRAMLMYRYRRLSEARYNAKQSGFEGAMFPWQSGSNGREESQKIHLNPQSGNWIPDDSRLQRHVNAAIAYNVWNYYQTTNDTEFLSFHGAEMLADIAKFWASIATWNEERERYDIKKVVGPDEYHTSYPDGDEPGLDNNAYTNVMAMWLLKHAYQALHILDERKRGELMEMLKITQEDLERWLKISKKMFISFVEGNKIISQYEGFEDLEELDWNHYHKKYGEILRLDRIMEKEGKDVNRYKATKQADVLMLFYLFSSEELVGLLHDAGYDFKPTYIPENVKYYEDRTAHGSTLSKLVHSWVLARSDRSKSWHNFREALMSDLKDIQGGTTSEGIHLGAMAGTVDLIQRCYTGLEVRDDALWLNPHLPESLPGIKFCVRYRGHWIQVSLTRNEIELYSEGGWSKEKVCLMLKKQRFYLKNGETKKFRYTKKNVEMIS